MNIKTLRLPLLMAAAITAIVSCKKEFKEKPAAARPLTPMSGSASVTINIEEAYGRLPQTIMYNLADQVTLHLDKVQWRYEEEYLMARIPLNEAENRSYLYAVKPYNAPTGPVRAYLVQFFHDPGSTQDDFSGRQMWLNLQDYNLYGVEYDHNDPVQFMDPTPINPYWESELYDAGLFYLDAGNKIAVYNNPQNPDTSATLLPWNSKHPGGRGKDLKCPDEGSHFFQNLMSGIGGVILSIGEFFNNGEGGAAPPWHQSNGDEGFYGGADGYTPPPGPGGSNNPTPPPPPPPINIWDQAGSAPAWFEAGESATTPTPIYVNGSLLDNAVAGGTSVMTITNPTVTYLVGTLGLNNNQAGWLQQNMNKATSIMTFLVTYTPDLTENEKKDIARDHLKMMMENTEYLERINDLTGNWWDRDQDGFIEAKKIHMELYLQSNMYGLIDCNDLSQQPLGTYQTVATYQPPASVFNRISDIISQNTPAYTPNNFKIKTLANATGPVVNCDYFYIKINSLPYLNGTQMTADQLLEYFRTHINDFIGSSVDVDFQPYTHFIAGSVNINETTKFNSSYESSLGAVIHIDMLNDGTIIESGYSRNAVADQHSFTFTTMYSPLDGDHPVSGNRRFGIFKLNGAHYFYICGVDRTNDYLTTLVNYGDLAFDGADALWHSVQAGMLDFCDTHQADAVAAEEKIARPEWEGPIIQFLKGQMTIQQFKDALNCP